MSLGLVNDFEFEQELARLNGVVTPKEEIKPIEIGVVKDPKPLGRPEGTDNVPEPVREVIASLAINGASHKEVAEAFDVSTQSVSAYKNGATSLATYHEPHRELGTHVVNVKQKIAKIATRKLKQSLHAITDDKIAELSPNKAAQLARDMSAIVKEMTSNEDDNGNKGVQVIFYSPRPVDKSNYERVIAHE